MTDKYKSTITVPPDPALAKLKSRQAVADAIHARGLPDDCLAALNRLLGLHWPTDATPDWRPQSAKVDVKYPDFECVGLWREKCRKAFRTLARLGYLELTEFNHRGPAITTNWPKLFEVIAPTDPEGSRGLRVSALSPPEASDENDSESLRPPGFEPEASEDSGGLSGRANEASGGLTGPQDNEDPNEIAEALVRVGNHIANILRQGFADVVAAIKNPEASGGLIRPPEPSPLNSNSIECKDINSIEFQIESEGLSAQKPEASENEPSPAAETNGDEVKWPNPWRRFELSDVTDDSKLEWNFQDAVRTAGWLGGDEGRRDFFTLAEFAKKLGSEKKVVAAFIKGVCARKFGPKRTTDQSANDAAAERLKRFNNARRARADPQGSVMAAVAGVATALAQAPALANADGERSRAEEIRKLLSRPKAP